MFHQERLGDPAKMKKPQTIFVCSMADLFGEWVPDLWIELIFSEIQGAKQHTYIFLTKNPARYLKIPGTYFSKNIWFGASVDGYPGVNGYQTIDTLQKLPSYANTFISFEPLLKDPGPLNLTGIKQVIIGAQTNPLIIPSPESEARVCFSARMADAKIFYKDSMPMAKCHKELCWSVHK